MLDKLFKPQSVALIGASDRPGSFGCDAAKSLMKSHEKLRFYFINQRKSEIFGIRTYPLLAELPEVPELVLIATPASTVNGLIRDAAQRGVRDFSSRRLMLMILMPVWDSSGSMPFSLW